MTGWTAFLWLASAVSAVVLGCGLAYILPALVKPVQADTALFLKEAVPALLPEPLEQARYIAAIVFVPVVFALIFLFKTKINSFFERSSAAARVLTPLTAVSQLSFLSVAVAVICLQNLYVHRYFPLWVEISCGAGALLLTWLAFSDRLGAVYGALDKKASWRFHAGAALITALALLPSVYTASNIPFALMNVQVHLPFNLGEFAAVVNGRCVLVDLFPQYEKFFGYLLWPFFKIFGINIFTFTLVMGLVSFIGLQSVYWCLMIASKGRRWGVLLYAVFIGAAIYATRTFGWERFYTFNYYAVTPIRYIALWLGCLLLSGYLEKPTKSGLFLLAGSCGFLAVNNMDFGIPVWAGTLAAISLGETTLIRPWREFLSNIGYFLLSVLVVLAGFWLFTYALCRQWPQASEMLMYQKIFALNGFMMLPMPATGLHWVIYAVFMAGLIVSISSSSRGLIHRLLMYGSVSGCGMAMYYVGRSHHDVLTAVFPAWIFVTVLLFLLLAEEFRKSGLSVRKQLLIPFAFLCFICLLFIQNLRTFPGPVGQARRLMLKDDTFTGSYSAVKDVIARFTAKGENVGIVCMYAHALAIDLGLNNCYPFVHDGSLILKSQVRTTIEAFNRKGVKKVFGKIPDELAEALKAAGFRQIATVQGIPFAIWIR